jgi:hypothetical protein
VNGTGKRGTLIWAATAVTAAISAARVIIARFTRPPLARSPLTGIQGSF